MVNVSQRYDARAMAMDADGEFTEVSVQFLAEGRGTRGTHGCGSASPTPAARGATPSSCRPGRRARAGAIHIHM